MRHGIFEFRNLTPEREAAIRHALDLCDYPWQRIIPYLRTKNRGEKCPVLWESRPGQWGSFWPNTAILLNEGLTGERAEEVFLFETAHLVDRATLTEDDRLALHRLMHPDLAPEEADRHITTGKFANTPEWDAADHGWLGRGAHHEVAGEAWMYLFTACFAPDAFDTPTPDGRYGAHWWGPEQVAEARRITLRRNIVTFNDVPADHTHRDAIEALAAAGIVQGRPDGTFGPDEPVTRGQLATILRRALDRKENP